MSLFSPIHKILESTLSQQYMQHALEKTQAVYFAVEQMVTSKT